MSFITLSCESDSNNQSTLAASIAIEPRVPTAAFGEVVIVAGVPPESGMRTMPEVTST